MINRFILVALVLVLAFISGDAWRRTIASAVVERAAIEVEASITVSAEQQAMNAGAEKHSNKVGEGRSTILTTVRAAVVPEKNPGLVENAGINLGQQTPAQLWQYWKMQLNRSEFQQIPIIGALLAEGLRKYPDPKVYQGIAGLLLQPDVAVENKAIVLDLLSEIATPDSLSQLIDLARQGEDFPLYILVLQAISRIGDNRWDGEFHEELSPILEAAWSDPENSDQAFLSAVGKAIATVGAPEGVDQLLLTVSGNGNGKAAEETNRIKQEVAFDVIPQVRNPDAVEVLSTWFEQEALGTPAFEVSGDALAEIGSPSATQEIVDWAKDAPAEGARNLNDWLTKIDDNKSLKFIAEAQNLEFQNPEIKAVIDTVAADINASTAISAASLKDDSGGNVPLP